MGNALGILKTAKPLGRKRWILSFEVVGGRQDGAILEEEIVEDKSEGWVELIGEPFVLELDGKGNLVGGEWRQK